MSHDNLKKDINGIIKDNKIYRFISQLKDCKNFEKKKIESILQCLQINELSDNIDPKQKLNDFIKTIDEHQYKKSWNKLRDFQKKNRLEEYINKLKLDDSIKNTLLQMLEEKKLKSNKSVNYDIIIGNIINIKCLILENNKYIISSKK